MTVEHIFVKDEVIKALDSEALPSNFWEIIKKYPDRSTALAKYLKNHVTHSALLEFGSKIDSTTWTKIVTTVVNDPEQSFDGERLTISDRALKIIETILESVGIAGGAAITVIGIVLVIMLTPEIEIAAMVLIIICISLACIVAGCAEVLALIHIWG